MLPIKLIKSPLEILPSFPVPSTFDRSILFSLTIFRTEGDKCSLVFGGIYFSCFASLTPPSTKVSRIKAPLGFSSLLSSTRVKVSCCVEIVFFLFFAVSLMIFFFLAALGGI
jgi:hypothetical protein